MKMHLMIGFASALAIGASGVVLAQQPAAPAGAKMFRITYENLTTGQTFSPSVFFTHAAGAAPLFKSGEAPSFGLMRLAEEGNVAPIADQMGMKKGKEVGEVYLSLPIGPGETRSVDVMVDTAHPLVSGVWMLGRTNDGFTGVNAIDIGQLTAAKSYDLMGLEAGTEKNNEKKESLIAMMGTGRDPENGKVANHPGIRGDADAPASWKFDPAKPVAKLTIAPVATTASAAR